MAKSFACRDIGFECDFTARAQDEDALFKKIGEHTKKAHNIRQMDRELMAKVESAMKDI